MRGMQLRSRAATVAVMMAAISAKADAAAVEAGGPEGSQVAVQMGEADASDVPPQAPASQASRNRTIEEVVVTSQKREQSIQTVPIAISAFSGEAMAARGIENVQQLGQVVPGMQYTAVGGFQLIYIRGLGTDNFVPSADPSIAAYVDGIYMPSGQGATQSLGNIERVEVLKGPQGTLFGRNATGGAVSIITADPGVVPQSSVQVEGGNFASRAAKANLSAPVSDWLRVGISAAYSDQDSYYDNAYYLVEDTEEKVARLKLGFYPADNLSLVLTGSYSRNSGIAALLSNNTTPSVLGQALLMPAAPDSYTSTNDYHVASTQRHKLAYGSLTWDLPAIDLKLIGSAQSNLDGGALDFDGSPLPIAAFSSTRQFTRQQTAELQLISKEDGWATEDFNWVAGLYYYHSKAGFDPAYLHAAPDLIESAASLANITLPQRLSEVLDRIPLRNTPFTERGTALSFTGILGTESTSAYAQGTYSFTDWLDLTLGGRYQHEKRALLESKTGTLNPAGGNELITLIRFPLNNAVAETFSPKAVLSINAADYGLIYASYSVGYKSGTYNIVNIYAPPNYIKPEKVSAYEIGAKLDLFSRRLRLNGAIFNNEIDDLQSGFVSLLTGGAISFVSVPHARTRGAEFDASVLPLPDWNAGLALTAGAAYVDAKYTDFPNGAGFGKNTGLFVNGVDLSGNRIARAPEWSGSLGIAQSIDVPTGVVEMAVDAYFNSGFFYDASNNVKEKGYSLLNASLGYLYVPWDMRMTLLGRNILDRRYHITQLQTDFGINKHLAPPRQYVLRLSWNF